MYLAKLEEYLVFASFEIWSTKSDLQKVLWSQVGFFISSQNWCCTSKQMWLFIFLELFCNAVCCQRKVIICSISEAVAVVFLWYLTTEKKVNMLYHAPLPRIQSNLTTPTSKPVFLWLLHYTGDERSKKIEIIFSQNDCVKIAIAL